MIPSVIVAFILIKILFITAIFAKAWMDAKGNKNQLDHIITGLFEASLVTALVIVHYWGYYSPINTGGAWAVLSYVLLRHGLFDIIRNRVSGKTWLYLGNNNWEDRIKRWMLKIENNKKIPILTLSRFAAVFFGLLI